MGDDRAGLGGGRVVKPGREVVEAWREAFSGLRVRHPDPGAKPWRLFTDDGILHVGCGNVHDTLTSALRDLPICSVRLTYFPGPDLARKWFAAAWAGYIQHEALELVTHDGVSPLNPHEEPYETNPYNRGLRNGFPSVLTPDALQRALEVVMDPSAAEILVR